jgi:glycosyltransferase involved in cell wall biosynthesis
VEFKGYLSPEGVREYQRHCSFLVFPAVWEEPFGIVATEAMAWAKPVIAFNVGGISDFVRDGTNGFLIPRKDIHQLALRMSELIGNEELRTSLGHAGREIIFSELNEDKFVMNVKNMLGKAVSAR